MNYKESKKIFKEIRKAEKILLNCHRGPDPDSIGGALAMYGVLTQVGKQSEIVCPSEELFDDVRFLKNYEKIRKGIDFSNFDFDEYDLFITLDSSSTEQVTGLKDFQTPIPLINIDHHTSNLGYGKINLIDSKKISTCEILYLVFRDWVANIDSSIATALLTGIIGDSGVFRYPGTTEQTLKIAGELMEKGADKDKIIFAIYGSTDLNTMKFWGEALRVSKIDTKGKFFWSAISHETFVKYKRPSVGRETAASLFAQTTDGTEFGFVAVEQEPRVLSISFRSRAGFDTSKIAEELGGGGHVYASGAKVEGLPFDKAVEKVLKVARKHAKKTKKKNN